jgi:hypothetical protein
MCTIILIRETSKPLFFCRSRISHAALDRFSCECCFLAAATLLLSLPVCGPSPQASRALSNATPPPPPQPPPQTPPPRGGRGEKKAKKQQEQEKTIDIIEEATLMQHAHASERNVRGHTHTYVWTHTAYSLEVWRHAMHAMGRGQMCMQTHILGGVADPGKGGFGRGVIGTCRIRHATRIGSYLIFLYLIFPTYCQIHLRSLADYRELL